MINSKLKGHTKNSNKIYFGGNDNYTKLLSVFINRLPHLKGTGADKDIINEFDFSIKEFLLLLSENINYYFQIEAFSKLILKQKLYGDIINNVKLSDQEYFKKIQNSIDQFWSSGIDYYINQTANFKRHNN